MQLYHLFPPTLILTLILSLTIGIFAGDDDKEQVMVLTNVYIEAWNNGDHTAIANYYTAESEYYFPNGDRLENRVEIESAHRVSFESVWKTATLNVTPDIIHLIKSDIAIVHGTWKISGITPQTEGAPTEMSGQYSNILVKKDGEWKIRLTRTMVPN
jgi:uncharacterized protein (TIGR02246 family)